MWRRSCDFCDFWIARAGCKSPPIERKEKRRKHLPAKLPPPPSWLPPLSRCHRHAAAAYAAAALPKLPTSRSCQAAASAAKLAAAPTLSPRIRRHRRPLRFNCYQNRCHRRRVCAFS